MRAGLIAVAVVVVLVGSSAAQPGHVSVRGVNCLGWLQAKTAEQQALTDPAIGWWAMGVWDGLAAAHQRPDHAMTVEQIVPLLRARCAARPDESLIDAVLAISR